MSSSITPRRRSPQLTLRPREQAKKPKKPKKVKSSGGKKNAFIGSSGRSGGSTGFVDQKTQVLALKLPLLLLLPAVSLW